MPDLYIANCTSQNQIVCFRPELVNEKNPPGFRASQQREIKPGQQIRAMADRTLDEVDSVVEQLRIYGLRGVADIPRLTNEVVPIVFNVDRAVTASQIKDVMEHNQRIKVTEGKDRRQRAAVASNELITETVAKELANRQLPSEAIPDNVETTVEFEQVEQSEAGEQRIEEGIRVRDDAPAPPPRKPQRRKPAQRAAA